MKSTALASTDASSWSSWGYYHDCSPVPLRMTPKDLDPSVPSTGSVFAASTYLVSKKNQNETEIIIEKVPASAALEPLSLPPIVKNSIGDTTPLTVCTSWSSLQGHGVGQGTQRPPLSATSVKKIGLTSVKQSGSHIALNRSVQNRYDYLPSLKRHTRNPNSLSIVNSLRDITTEEHTWQASSQQVSSELSCIGEIHRGQDPSIKQRHRRG